MRSFVKLHLYYVQRSLENVINITMNWQNFNTLRVIKSHAKIYIHKAETCLNNYKSSKTIDFVEFV